ncbi:MAG: flagellar motor switch phosphatase FliY [Firmicutes bacterium]|jgi:flagellar motor switch protein FliN/FliY|nr:flagellar motor switch phosphatase FliY [Bacillota bacterium]
MDSFNLDDQQKDALAEVGNISMGAAATALSQLVNKKVQITAPRVSLVNISDVQASFPKPCVIVTVKYVKGLTGENVFIVSEKDALFIVGMMMGMFPPEKPDDLGEMELSAVSEAMNQMMGSAATAMADFFYRPVEISPPQVEYKDLQKEDIDLSSDRAPLIQVAFRMMIEDILDSELLQLIPIEHGGELASFLLAGLSKDEAEIENMENMLIKEKQEDYAKEETDAVSPLEEDPSIETFSEPLEKDPFFTNLPDTQNNHFFNGYEDSEKISLIRDIPLEIIAVFGKKKLSLREVFSLNPGETIALERQLGEPLDLFVNERLVARGEVVLVNGQFGVKITEMIRSGSD